MSASQPDRRRQEPRRVSHRPAASIALPPSRELSDRRVQLRFDVLIGVVVGFAVLLLAPGVAMAGLIALVVLALIAGTILVGRRRRRRKWRQS